MTVVLLFGEFGIGNLGNEACLTEALRRLRTHLPDVTAKVLSYDPAQTLEQHGPEHPGLLVEPILRAGPPGSGAARVAERLVDRLPGRGATLVRRLGDVRRVARASRGADLVLVPGTGVFEELWVGAWGVPVLLAGLALGARVHRAPLAVLAVGADLPERRLTRGLFRWTLRSAALCSVRDDHSARAVQTLLGGRDDDAPRITPDLVLGAPAPPPRPPTEWTSPPRLALGVMRYYGPTDDPEAGAAIHERYLDGITATAADVAAAGWEIDVVVGDAADAPVAHEVAARIGPRAHAQIVTSVRELDEVITGSTVVVATRFHNVVSAVRTGVPPISVSYGAKGHALMARVGLDRYCQWIEELDPVLLRRQLDELVGDGPLVSAALERHARDLRVLSSAPWEAIGRLLTQRMPTSATSAARPTVGEPA